MNYKSYNLVRGNKQYCLTSVTAGNSSPPSPSSLNPSRHPPDSCSWLTLMNTWGAFPHVSSDPSLCRSLGSGTQSCELWTPWFPGLSAPPPQLKEYELNLGLSLDCLPGISWSSWIVHIFVISWISLPSHCLMTSVSKPIYCFIYFIWYFLLFQDKNKSGPVTLSWAKPEILSNSVNLALNTNIITQKRYHFNLSFSKWGSWATDPRIS